jgi:hypothetical protein
MVKRMPKKEKMLNEYILLSCTFAVVTSAVRDTTGSPVAVVHVRCSLYPKTHPLVWLYPHHLASRPIAEVGANPSSWMICVPYNLLILSEYCLLLLL